MLKRWEFWIVWEELWEYFVIDPLSRKVKNGETLGDGLDLRDCGAKE